MQADACSSQSKKKLQITRSFQFFIHDNIKYVRDSLKMDII